MSLKKIALVSLCKGEVNSVPPLALLYLATALKKYGHEARIIHKNADDVIEVLKEIEEYEPVLVGMTVFTGYNNKKYADLSRALKKKNYTIVWGNAHASLLPEQALAEEFIDFVVFGEGEETIVELVEKIDKPAEYSKIKGIAYKDQNKKIIINPKRDFINPDDYLIDWSLIDLEYYLKPYFSGRYKRVLVVTTSRGCPHNCQFCYNLVFNNRRWRAHSAEKFIENLLPIIEKYNIDALRFLDDNFFVDKARAFGIVKNLGLPYFAEARLEYIDEEFVKNLQATKCQEIMFGFESGSERILKEVVQKGTGVEQILNATRLLKNTGITMSGGFIFGLPTETKEEYALTMKFIVKMLEVNRNLAFSCGWYLPFPGTGLYKKAIECGFKPPERIEDWDKFDRWRSDYKLDWIDWDYEKAVLYSREIVNLLALCYKRNIPIFRELLTWRVKHLNYSFPIDIFIIAWLRNNYFSKKQASFFGKIMNQILKKIVRIKENKKAT
jgi:radical SAM superfamily enzyme YgiQ (UPF0313 family)